jgi:hypothetical protein
MRRSLVVLVLVYAVACSEKSAVPSDPFVGVTDRNDTITITVNPATVGPTIPSNFIGLSVETSSMLEPAFRQPAMVNVLKAIGPGVLRIGGGSKGGSDRAWWTPGARVARADSAPVLIGSDFDQLFSVCRSANWTAIVGVNFAAAQPDTFAAEAAFVQQHGGSLLTAIELGNEPDIYAGPFAGSVRPPSYNFVAYAKELDAYLAAFQQRAPNVPIAAPSTSYDTAWFRQTVAHAPSRFALATQHLYALTNDPGGVPTTSTRYPTAANLLSDTLRRELLGFDKVVVAAGKPYGVPARLTEFNSANLGGKVGVSGTFASSLWALDHLFSAAEAALAGVNFHTGITYNPTGAGYSVFGIMSDGTLTPRPVLYGILAFQDAAKGQILTVTPTSKRPWNVSAHAAVTSSDGTVRLALVNKDTASLTVRVVAPNAKTVTVRRLVDQASTSQLSDSTGVTYAGAAVTASGTFTPLTGELIVPVANTFVVSMPSLTAAIVVITTK